MGTQFLEVKNKSWFMKVAHCLNYGRYMEVCYRKLILFFTWVAQQCAQATTHCLNNCMMKCFTLFVRLNKIPWDEAK